MNILPQIFNGSIYTHLYESENNICNNDSVNHQNANEQILKNNDDASRQFDLVNAVNDDLDKSRGPRFLDDVYLHLDDVSADDLLLEKSMMIKRLISRYTNTVLNKPRDLMFAIIECISSGILLYFMTRRADCCLIDSVEVYNSDIFCLTGEWVFGFISEQVDYKQSDDKVNNSRHSDNHSHKSRHNNLTKFSYASQTDDTFLLPPVFHLLKDDEMHSNADFNSPGLDNIEHSQLSNEKKMSFDMKYLKKNYTTLNVNVISDVLLQKQNHDRENENGHSDTSGKMQNILKLFVDFKELERLITFLVYVDRESQYNDIEVNIKNKPATNRSYCSNDDITKRKCLQVTDGDKLRRLYSEILDTHLKTPGGLSSKKNESQTTQSTSIGESNNDTPCSDISKIFESLTLLFLDKISITLVESLLYDSGRFKRNYSYKFGIIDIIQPKVGKMIYNKCNIYDGTFKAKSSSDKQHINGVSFDG